MLGNWFEFFLLNQIFLFGRFGPETYFLEQKTSLQATSVDRKLITIISLNITFFNVSLIKMLNVPQRKVSSNKVKK